ncbi:TetR/AcrR family transcriptional regulator [Micromonospora sp. WMMA1363]|uniref:TetR/AcrR family transcriptional regulator n=1 Tax=Micromonospora sp. WMMA1363 TaxID=3053985 RepID=UPI00259CE511|nr:TetR/AcrR family transcriptional regulator [Micromonospora sp. WMMA1363]MDM4722639.1 TetR/AcrR family transcriptional regulator [Micromonospora sp. WMMA1363]
MPTTTRNRTAAQAEEIREHVLDTADRLYYSRGIHAVGMDALRDEAGVSLKRLYQLFPSKDALVEAVLQRRRHIWNARVDDAVTAGGPTPRGQLLAIYDMLARWSNDDGFRGCIFVNTFSELGATTPHIATLIRDQKTEFQNRLASIVATTGAPAALAHQLAVLAEGAQTTAAITGTTDPIHHAHTAATTLIDTALNQSH